jgi:hypothetical protein
MINAGHQNPRSQRGWTRYSNGTTTHRGYIDTGSRGYDRRKRSAKITRITIYLFFAALLTCGILIIAG